MMSSALWFWWDNGSVIGGIIPESITLRWIVPKRRRHKGWWACIACNFFNPREAKQCSHCGRDR